MVQIPREKSSAKKFFIHVHMLLINMVKPQVQAWFVYYPAVRFRKNILFFFLLCDDMVKPTIIQV